MKHILGMAKSNLDFKGGKSSKLELDILRLIYAIKTLQEIDKNVSAKGYMMIIDIEGKIETRIKGWLTKYKADSLVEILAFKPSESDLEEWIQEKSKNQIANLPGASKNDAIAYKAKEWESKLFDEIKEKEGENVKVLDLTKESLLKQPLGIRWDFYGIIE